MRDLPFLLDRNWNKRSRMPSPQISVLMPVWNGERFLAESVESLLAQTFEDFEVVVVDGGSTDRTLEILAGYNDPRIKIFQAPPVPGVVAARNFGLQKARAPWIAVHDCDDISLPHRLEKQWEALNRHPNAVICYTDVELIGEGSDSTERAHLPKTQACVALKFCYYFPVVHSTVMFKKEAALAAGGYPGPQSEDYALIGKLVHNGESVAVADKLVKFRLHSISASNRHQALMIATAKTIAVEHCQDFMRLSPEDAKRAHEVLVAHGDCSWKEWIWFLRHCVPRLRLKSAEMYAWLGWQTLKMFR
jgi:glycosyltransferase involved in cell wall biosynthesis